MILHADSKRLIEAELAVAVAAAVPPLVARVGVFVDARPPFVTVLARSLRLDLVQLHGTEGVDYIRALPSFRVVKAINVRDWDQWANVRLPNLAALLVDSGSGGTGVANDWDAVDRAMKRSPAQVPVFFAGGLKPESVGDVVRRFAPYAVDVSSGVEEAPGWKGADKVNAFVRSVRDADSGN